MPRVPQPPQPLGIPQDWRPTMGAFLRERRKALGWSREKLAEVAGFSRNHVSKIERGVEVGLQTLVLVCAALGVRPGDAFHAAGL